MSQDYLKYAEQIHSASLQELMQEHGQHVWNYAFLLTRNHHAADDIAQHVFVQAFLRISSFRGQASVRTWLLSIARNLALNYLKSHEAIGFDVQGLQSGSLESQLVVVWKNHVVERALFAWLNEQGAIETVQMGPWTLPSPSIEPAATPSSSTRP